ncbi:MAG: DUF5320 domain-containing protein [Candidatus Coatesbacteria bacterium]|nr:MAG: DUF5320 domain-containing protein [Candidatus Coatesbacteria bacterium]
MPGGDRTGPAGAGPMTGRGLGCCAGNAAPGYAYGRGGFGGGGYGGGFRRAPGTGGRGRGRMNVFYATGLPGYARYGYGVVPTAADEAVMLRNQSAVLEQELQLVKERLGVLEKETKEKGK